MGLPDYTVRNGSIGSLLTIHLSSRCVDLRAGKVSFHLMPIFSLGGISTHCHVSMMHLPLQIRPHTLRTTLLIGLPARKSADQTTHEPHPCVLWHLVRCPRWLQHAGVPLTSA